MAQARGWEGGPVGVCLGGGTSEEAGRWVCGACNRGGGLGLLRHTRAQHPSTGFHKPQAAERRPVFPHAPQLDFTRASMI